MEAQESLQPVLSFRQPSVRVSLERLETLSLSFASDPTSLLYLLYEIIPFFGGISTKAPEVLGLGFSGRSLEALLIDGLNPDWDELVEIREVLVFLVLIKMEVWHIF